MAVLALCSDSNRAAKPGVNHLQAGTMQTNQSAVLTRRGKDLGFARSGPAVQLQDLVSWSLANCILLDRCDQRPVRAVGQILGTVATLRALGPGLRPLCSTIVRIRLAARSNCSGVILGLRPRARVAVSPAFVRSAIRLRSNSANMPQIWNSTLPARVRVSLQESHDTSLMPCCSSLPPTRWSLQTAAQAVKPPDHCWSPARASASA